MFGAMAILTQITETATQPASAVPVTGLVAAGNILGALPEFVNILTALYILLLIVHKIWKMYAEWKAGSILKDTNV